VTAQHNRLTLCVAMALALHAGVLGWASGMGASDSASNMLRMTRAAGAAQAARDPKVSATQDQRGDASIAQQLQTASSSQQAGGNPADPSQAVTATRFVVVADHTLRPDQHAASAAGTASYQDDRTARAQQIRDAAADPRARYLARWQQDIEALGSRRYPSQLLASGQPRRLTMAVRLAPDGRLLGVRVVHSSGVPDLDAAAAAIVRDAAPFAPYDAALGDSGQRGTLTFAYDWLFQTGSGTQLQARD